MAKVEWIKQYVDMFDGNSFKKIKRAKIGGESYRDKLTAIWSELMAFAGKCNADGRLIESPEVQFLSIEDLAVFIDREPDELNLCMQFYIANHMVVFENDIYTIANWDKYQNTDRLAEIREYNRLAQQKSRAKRKALKSVNDKSMTSQSCQGTEVDKEVDKEKDTELDADVVKDNTDSEQNTFELMGGTLGRNVILLTPAQDEELLDKLGFDAYNHYVDKLATFIIEKGAKVSNHYATILKWAREDAMI